MGNNIIINGQLILNLNQLKNNKIPSDKVGEIIRETIRINHPSFEMIWNELKDKVPANEAGWIIRQVIRSNHPSFEMIWNELKDKIHAYEVGPILMEAIRSNHPSFEIIWNELKSQVTPTLEFEISALVTNQILKVVDAKYEFSVLENFLDLAKCFFKIIEEMRAPSIITNIFMESALSYSVNRNMHALNTNLNPNDYPLWFSNNDVLFVLMRENAIMQYYGGAFWTDCKTPEYLSYAAQIIFDLYGRMQKQSAKLEIKDAIEKWADKISSFEDGIKILKALEAKNIIFDNESLVRWNFDQVCYSDDSSALNANEETAILGYGL